MAVGVAIKEARARLRSHRKVQRKLCPIITPTHVSKRGIRVDARSAEWRATVPARLHGEKMFERLPPPAEIGSIDAGSRKEAEHGLPHIVDITPLDGQPHQS